MPGTHLVDVAGDVVVKEFRSWARDEHRHEWAALRHLDRHSPGLAPAPLRADLDREPPRLAMTRLPGTPFGAGPLTDRKLDALTAALHRLFAVPTSGIRRRALAPERAAGYVTARRPERPPDDPAVAAVLAEAVDHLHHTGPPGDGVVAVFGHGDANLDNYLWDGKRVRIVDFEDSGVSDRAYELAILAEHLSAWPQHLTDPAPLLDRFGLDAPERRRLHHFRRVWALFWLVLLLPGGPAAGRNPPGTLHLQAGRLRALLRRDH